MKKFILAPLTVVFAALVFIVPLSKAADTAGVKIQPAIVDDKVDPGQVFHTVLQVTNVGAAGETYYFDTRDIAGVSDSGQLQLQPADTQKTGYELSSWVSVSPSSVGVEPGQTKDVAVTVTVPQNAAAGAHYGAVYVLTHPPKISDVSGSAVGYGVGMILSLRVGGQAVEGMNIREFSTGRLIYGGPDVTFITKVENVGNVLIRPHGPLEIRDMFGRKVGSLIVNATGGVVLPHAIRQFQNSWTGDSLAFGRFDVIESLVYGENAQQTVSRYTSFWILPVKIIFPVLGGALVLIGLAYWLIRRQINKKLEEMGKVGGRSRGSKGMHTMLVVGVVLALLAILLLLVLFIFLA